MGRGRNGPAEQSIKKPKGLKFYSEDLQIFLPHVKKEKFTPLLLSEDLLAEMKKNEYTKFNEYSFAKSM